MQSMKFVSPACPSIELRTKGNQVAGPDRPIPQDVGTSGIVNRDWQAQAQSRAQEIANQASQAGASLYANLTAAVSERG